jgi:TfoX/Sxy family transcriptional regulator of competence genes
MTKEKNNSIPAYVTELYDKLVSTIPGIERKGAAMPYTSFNGHMFSFLAPDGTMALRLAEKERNEFLDKFKTVLVVRHGIVMKEYAAVPESLLQKTKELSEYFTISLEYIKTLKPKATKKK